MDLIYANKNKKDLGILLSYKFDLAYGVDENDFEITIDTQSHCAEAGYFIYIEGTEYGGVIDSIRVETETNNLVYMGRTWHGILESKILQPDNGQDYLILSGDANAVLGTLISRMALTSMFSASSESSGVTITSFKMDRYINGYEGIRKMLKKYGLKLNIAFKNGFAELSAVPIVDYSNDDEFDSTQLQMVIEKHYHPINHMICLGKGDLKERTVIHLYSDGNGNISKTQTFFGIDERCATYENANTESIEELEKGGTEALEKYMEEGKLDVDLDATQVYGIGDIVAAREVVTDIQIKATITKKIVTINNGIVEIQHKVG